MVHPSTELVKHFQGTFHCFGAKPKVTIKDMGECRFVSFHIISFLGFGEHGIRLENALESTQIFWNLHDLCSNVDAVMGNIVFDIQNDCKASDTDPIQDLFLA